MRVKKLVKIIVFCSIFLILLNRIYTILSWKDTAGEYYSSVDSYYELDEDIVDVLFFGSSHCYCSVDPSVLWDDHGIGSFNLAISGQDWAGSYYTLKEAVKTQSPELVLVDLYGAVFSGYLIEGNLYRNTLPFKISKNSYDMVDSLVTNEEDKRAFWFRWPMLHTRYKELKKEDFITNPPTYLGYHAEFHTQPSGELKQYHGAEITLMPEEREEWLTKIIDFTRENNIELCFFVAPYAIDEVNQKLINHAKQIAEAEDIPVVDLVDLADEIGLDPNTDFLDYGHTNHSGAQKVSKYLGDYIASNYELEDRRGDERYALWDDNSVVRNHEEQNWNLRFLTDIDSYLDNVMKLEDYVVVVSTLGNHLSETVDVYSTLSEYGIGGEFYSAGGIWVYEDGVLTMSITENNALKHIDLGTNDMLLSRADGVNSIMVNKSIFQKPIDGINILVYDKKLGAVADCIGFSAPHDYGVYR